jgi:alkylhydroperoxidase/carboxymuconolactone decarboxylase family protein YurZ
MSDGELSEARSLARTIKHQVLGLPETAAANGHDDAGPNEASHEPRPFQDWVDRAVWAGIWAREGLDLRSRSVATIALLTAMRADDAQLTDHLRAGMRNGLGPAEIEELLLHVAAYAGAPAARRALHLLDALQVQEDGPA